MIEIRIKQDTPANQKADHDNPCDNNQNEDEEEEEDLLAMTKKTFHEFQAFHMALSLKFKTLAIVQMPPDPTFAS